MVPLQSLVTMVTHKVKRKAEVNRTKMNLINICVISFVMLY